MIVSFCWGGCLADRWCVVIAAIGVKVLKCGVIKLFFVDHLLPVAEVNPMVKPFSHF